MSVEPGPQFTDYVLKAYKSRNGGHRVAAIGGESARPYVGEEIGELKTDDEGITSSLYVTPRFRRQGVATAMWRHMQELAEKGKVPQPKHADPELQSEAAKEFSKKVY